MPIQTHGPKFCSSLYPDSRSWTDDIPVCKESGIGLSTNQVYREDGHRQEEHPFEDQSFHFKYDDETYMYGVFDGHDGVQTAKFAVDNIVAEVLLGQLTDVSSDEEIKQILRHAFLTVERCYLNAVGDKIAERASLLLEIPDDLTQYEAYQQYPLLVTKLNALNTELSCGLTAVVALIYKSRLYVANVGNSRALLCRTDENGVLRALQLSVDHDLSNEDELLRLSLLGLNTDKFSKGFCIGNQEYTRCLGNYLIKGAYKEFEDLVDATAEPVIATPDIIGSIQLDESCRFLMLMSDGLYKSLEEATETQNVNKELAQMVVEQFRVQSTLTGVAQAVVDKVVRIHHDVYMSRSGSDRVSVSRRDDITLVIRNFNYPMPNAISPIPGPRVNIVLPSPIINRPNYLDKLSENSPKTTATESNSEETLDSRSGNSSNELLSNDRIKPYVDFSVYYENVEKARKEGILPNWIQFT